MASTPILFVPFSSRRAFLRAYEPLEGPGGLVFPTRASVAPGDPVILEIRFPGLPSRVLVRGEVTKQDEPPGWMTVRFDLNEEQQRDFMLDIARDRHQGSNQRRSRRYPVELPVLWRVEGVNFRHQGSTENISAGGIMVSTEWAPPVGTDLTVTVSQEGTRHEMALRGRVIWTRQEGSQEGMGIVFRDRATSDMSRLRRMLERFRSAGNIDPTK